MAFDTKMFEVKASDTEEGVIYGYAAKFGNIDRANEIILPGSLLRKDIKVPLLWNHNTNVVLGHAYITEDAKGYAYKGVFAINSENEDLRREARKYYTLVKEGHVDRNSIGYRVLDYGHERREGKTVRVLKKLDVAEVSIVPMPCNPEAGVDAVKYAETEESLRRQLEELKLQMEEIKGLLQEKQQTKNVHTAVDESKIREFFTKANMIMMK